MELFKVTEVVNPSIYDGEKNYLDKMDERAQIEESASLSMSLCCSCGDQWSSQN